MNYQKLGTGKKYLISRKTHRQKLVRIQVFLRVIAIRIEKNLIQYVNVLFVELSSMGTQNQSF